MTEHELVVFAFVRIGEAGHLAETVRVQIGSGAAREHLMHVALVGYIEHDAVTRRIEYAVQGHRGLHHAQIGADMTAVLVAICQQRGANLTAEFGELVGGKGLDIGRAGNAAQQMGVVAMGRGNARGYVVKACGPLGSAGDGEGIA